MIKAIIEFLADLFNAMGNGFEAEVNGINYGERP